MKVPRHEQDTPCQNESPLVERSKLYGENNRI